MVLLAKCITPIEEKNNIIRHIAAFFARKNKSKSFFISIFTFNKHFDKENECVYEPVITKLHGRHRLFITVYIVNFLLFEKKNSTYLMKKIVTCVAK